MTVWRLVLAACLTVAMAGCSAAHTAALKTIDPAQFQRVVQDAAAKLQVPGALVLAQTPQGTFAATVGTTELGAQKPPQPDTHFRIASNTKTMTAALIVLLAQDGKLTLDTPISAYVEGVSYGEKITLTDLLTMRSGLYCYTDAPELSTALDQDPSKAWTTQEVLAIAFAHPPTASPDSTYEYCNTNYALLGLVAEKVGGRPLAEQLHDRLFAPLGMRGTTLPATNDTTLPEPYAHGYMYGTTRYAMVDEAYPADMIAAARAGTLKPIDYTRQNPSYAQAAGGAISTATDLATWMRALVTGKGFDADHHQQWLNSLRPEDPAKPDGQRYGYGISYQRYGPQAAMYYHGGEMPGFNSFMGFDPDNDVALVIWTNLTLSPDGRTTANALVPTVLNEIYSGLDLG